MKVRYDMEATEHLGKRRQIPEAVKKAEAAYRRGFQHGLVCAGRLLENGKEKTLIIKAVGIAGRFRFSAKHREWWLEEVIRATKGRSC